jgi:hypothetical protein
VGYAVDGLVPLSYLSVMLNAGRLRRTPEVHRFPFLRSRVGLHSRGRHVEDCAFVNWETAYQRPMMVLGFDRLTLRTL